jgi:serine/threonine protein kinase
MVVLRLRLPDRAAEARLTHTFGRSVWSTVLPRASAADQAGAALAAAAQRAASSAAGAAADAGMSALKSVFARAAPASAAPALDKPTSVSVDDVTAACESLGLVLGERMGKGSRATVFGAVGMAGAPKAGAADDTRAPNARPWRAGETVAVKALLDEIAPATLEELASEAELWSSVRHEGVVRLLHASLSPAPLLVLEACEGGTLFAALRRGDALDVCALALDVARALAAVHAAGQAHRDIKSANVLLTRVPGEGGRVTAKLCDWGSAALLPNSLPARPLPPTWPSALFSGVAGAAAAAPVTWTPVGTLLWMAPEMLDPHLEGSKPPRGASGATADVYSFGVLLWELLERRLPWVEPVKVKRAEVLRVVVKEGKRLPVSPWVSKEVRRVQGGIRSSHRHGGLLSLLCALLLARQ